MVRCIAPISREEGESRERELNEVKHFTRVVLPTTKKYDRMIKLWKNFYAWKGEDLTSCLQRREEPPSAGKLKMFMEYIFDISEGQLDENITLKSLINSWYSFRSAYERETYTPILDDTGKDVLGYIKTELRERGLSLRRRRKMIADHFDISWLLKYLWRYDQYHFRHPRQRVSLSFLILLLVYTGTRAGTLVESSAYRATNQAPRYKDFQLIGLPNTHRNGFELILKVRFRYEKGKRSTNNEADDHLDYKWITFYEDTLCRGHCPITYFLGHAFSDDAFVALDNESDFNKLRVSSHKHSIAFDIKESKKNLHIFRRCLPDGSISPYLPMTYQDLFIMLSEAGYRAGFKDHLKPFNIRRGTANDVEGDVSVSQNQYAQLLGHAVKTMGAYYISSISGVDTQGIVNGTAQRKDHIQQVRSMSLNLNIHIPERLPFAELEKVRKDAKYVSLLTEEEALAQEIQQQKSIDDVLCEKYRIAKSKRKVLFQTLCSVALRSFRESYFRNENSEDIRNQIREANLGIVSDDDKDNKRLLNPLDLVSTYHFRERSSVANLFWVCSPQNITKEPQIIRDLWNMCKPESCVLYYFGEGPVNDMCPICRTHMKRVSRKKRADHIHKCMFAQNSKLCNAEYDQNRPLKCKWANCESCFAKKTCFLLPDFGNDINDSTERANARRAESKRLHMERENLSTQSSKSEKQTNKSISWHLNKHVKNKKKCCWDGCTLEFVSEIDLRRHLLEFHQLSLRQAPFKPKFCYEHPENGWFLDEFKWEDHCKTHLDPISRNFNINKAYGTILRGLQCPYCLGKEDALASDRITQFNCRGTFNRHIEFHEKKIPRGPLQCPVPDCDSTTFANYKEVWVHFSDKYHLNPKGYSKSRGFKGSEENSDSESSNEWEEADERAFSDRYDEEDDGDWDDNDSNLELEPSPVPTKRRKIS